MKTKIKVAIAFGILAAGALVWGYDDETGFISKSEIYNDIITWPQRIAAARREKEEIEWKKAETKLKIQQAGICFEAVEKAARAFGGGVGQVLEILDIPEKVGVANNGSFTICSAKVLTGGMWTPNMKWIMTYHVMENNGFYQIIASFPSGRAD